MIVLDITIMNIALPSAQTALRFSDVDRQWVITGYALAFGSLLLLGGRPGDLFGRKVTFLTGLTGFAVASAVGGVSTSFTMLITARACQGAFAALLAPAALGLLTSTFSDSRERGRAFGVYGAIAGGGGLVGLLLGGVLTEYLDCAAIRSRRRYAKHADRTGSPDRRDGTATALTALQAAFFERLSWKYLPTPRRRTSTTTVRHIGNYFSERAVGASNSIWPSLTRESNAWLAGSSGSSRGYVAGTAPVPR
jgi:MFS family permease